MERVMDKAESSGGFLYATVADARRTDTHLLFDSVDHRTYPTQIRIPSPAPSIICVADHVSKMRRFAAQLTLRHRSSHLNRIVQ